MATDFYLFPLLPLELRRKIWYHSFPLFPRIFEITVPDIPQNTANFIHYAVESYATPQWAVTVSQAPSLANVNKEARTEFLLHSCTFHSIVTPVPYRNLRFCPFGDVLFINLESQRTEIVTKPLGIMLDEIFGNDAAAVQNNLRTLAGNNVSWARQIMPNKLEPLLAFPRLETTIYVLGCSVAQRHKLMKVIEFGDWDLSFFENAVGFRVANEDVKVYRAERGLNFEHIYCGVRLKRIE